MMHWNWEGHIWVLRNGKGVNISVSSEIMMLLNGYLGLKMGVLTAAHKTYNDTKRGFTREKICHLNDHSSDK